MYNKFWNFRNVIVSALAISSLLFSNISNAQQSTTGPVRPSDVSKGIVMDRVELQKTPAVIIQNVPSYLNQHGCGPTAVGMVIGFYDSHDFIDLIEGETDTQTENVNDAIANTQHYNDFSLPIDASPNLLQDRSELGGAHESNCIADFMKTSWSSKGNYYRWSWYDDIAPAFNNYINLRNDEYIVTTSNILLPSSDAWDSYKEEIDNNRPVVLLVDTDGNDTTDHFVTGIGYDDSESLYGIYDTWDQNIHWYSWRGMAKSNTWGIYGITTFNLSKTLGTTEVYSLTSTTANRRAQTITFPESGIIKSVSIYHNGGTGQVLLGVFADASGAPGTRLGVTPATTVNSTAGWQTVSLTSPLYVTSGQKVWLSWVFENNPGVRYIAGTPARAQSVALWAGGMPDPFGSATFGNYRYSIYCTYSTGGAEIPSVTTAEITSITNTSAQSGGNVTSDGGSSVTTRGVCWDTSPNPLVSLATKTTDGTGTGAFTSAVTGLSAGTTYYIRAYATNITGTAYGNEISFTTNNSDGISDVDGNYYNIVTIGSQIWMAENLKTTKYNDGILIPYVTDNITWGNLTTPAYCWYKNDINNKSIYGALYNWYTVSTNKLCPMGWRVPTDEEWTTLTTYLGGETAAGGKLKEQGPAHWLSPNTGATNESGFTALPGGDRSDKLGSGVFFAINGFTGRWWSSTIYNLTNIWIRHIDYNGATVYRSNITREHGISIRCIKDYFAPTVTTSEITLITQTSAQSGGTVTSEGGSPNTARGVCWSTSPNPTVDLATKTSDGTGTGAFTSSVTGLSSGTTYYLRAYATNNFGTAYGNEISFKTYNSDGISDVEGNYYNIVTIGSQIWMAENLRTTKYRNGEAILTGLSDTEWGNATSGAYAIYDNNNSNNIIYGKLYNWYAVNDNRNLCPTGWNVPTDIDLTVLSDYLGGIGIAGGKLKEAGYSHWLSPNSGATNESGFMALPAGERSGDDGGYYELTKFAWFWSSTYYSPGWAIARGLGYNYSHMSEGRSGSKNGHSVRCLKDVKGKPIGNTEVYTLSSTTPNRRAQTITFPEAGTIQSISIYHNGGTGSLLLGIYADASGAPAARLGVTQATTISTAAGWQTVSLTSPVTVTSGQKVWLSWVFENNPGVRYVAGTPARAQSAALWAGGMPDPFGTATYANYKYSVYCTYIPGGSQTKINGITEVYTLSSTTANRRAQTITFSEAGTIQSISIYHNGGTGQLLLGVYADASGAPATRLGVTPATTINLTAGWQTVSLTSPVSVTSGQKVWLSWVFENNPGVRYVAGTPSRTQSAALWSGGMPDPFGSASYANYKYSVYCTYIPGALQTKTNGITEVYSLSSTTANRRAQTITFTEAGTIQSISIYHNGGSGQLLLGIYADASGAPAARLGVTPATTINSTAGWQTVSLTSPVSITSGQKVWLSWVFENNPGVRYVAGTPARAQSAALWAGGMPDTFGASTFANYKYSVYCTYSTTGGDEVKSVNESLDIQSMYMNNEEVLIYPNPTDGDFTVTWKNRYGSRLNIAIYNILGKVVKEVYADPDINEISLDLNGHSSGIYLFEMKNKKNNLILNRSRIIKK